MPPIDSDRIGLAFDMAGCPNRCRHCWLTCPPNGPMDAGLVREVVARFRGHTVPGGSAPRFGCIQVSTWYREPDFSPHYRRLRELELELGDEPVEVDWQLLSVWRLAREPGYAGWAREHRGTSACQISLFGVGDTNDSFYRRSGAYDDCLSATEACLAAGIRPRWQLFLTKMMVPHLREWAPLIRRMRLRERCREMGGAFVAFIHTPDPEGEGFDLEHLRPTERDVAAVPEWLLKETRAHMGTSQPLGEPETALVSRVLSGSLAVAPFHPPQLWFDITPDLDVYPAYAEHLPWWRLGSLATDSVTEVINRYESEQTPGLRASHHIAVAELAERFGRRHGRRYYTPSQLHARWVGLWCRGEAQRHARCRT